MEEVLFYCTPQRKEREGLGNYIHEICPLSDRDAKKVRDAYNNRKTAYNILFATVCTLVGLGIEKKVTALGFGLATGSGYTAADYFLSGLGDQLDSIIGEDGDVHEVDMKYRYVRHGSQNGYYKISSVKLV